jgi:hypothetical protein
MQIEIKEKTMNTKTIEEQIKAVLRRYFEMNDHGDANPEHDDCFTAADAIDNIHSIVGDI